MKQKHLSDLSFFINRKRKTHMPVYLHTEKKLQAVAQKTKGHNSRAS
ncbi:MAG: hypothetical protein LRY76_08565 [Alphaproteobacteria bacterium]|nr:hypothetical protein [Alphaproteobacteria bacterium]